MTPIFILLPDFATDCLFNSRQIRSFPSSFCIHNIGDTVLYQSWKTSLTRQADKNLHLVKKCKRCLKVKARKSMGNKFQEGNGERLLEVLQFTIWTDEQEVPEEPWNFSDNTTCNLILSSASVLLLLIKWHSPYLGSYFGIMHYHLATPLI